MSKISKYIFILLILLLNTSLFGQDIIPRLFKINWGTELNDVNEKMSKVDPSFKELTYFSSFGDRGLDEETMSQKEEKAINSKASLKYHTEGTAFFNIAGNIIFTFYNPGTGREKIKLSKVEVFLSKVDNDNKSVNTRLLFKDIVMLFNDKYYLTPDSHSEKNIYETNKYETMVRGINVGIIAEPGQNSSVYISYENVRLKEQIAKRETELQTDVEEEEEVVIEEEEKEKTKEKTEKFERKGFSVRLIADISANPYIYNPFETSYGNAMYGYIMLGAIINKFTIGGAFRYDYESFDGIDPDSTFHGAWAILGGSANFMYQPFKWFEFSCAVGGSWFASAFEYDELGLEEKDEGGISFNFHAAFTPWKYITLKIPTKLDIFFGEDAVSPYFYGGFRADFHPYFTWINLYVEFGVQPWDYRSDFFDTTTAFFIWSIGASVDIDFKRTVKELIKFDKNNR